MAVRTVISRSRERVASDAGSSRGTEAGEDEQVRHKSVREIAMSSITKLLIQGIRGFGVRDEQKAVIEFGKPLTLITGQNGAGKTTIIECLKYITTGDLPPNSKGGAFVHDPKLVNEQSVRGVVKLKFQSISGDSVVCHRILQSVQKPRKLEQKTLDSSLEKIGPGGQKIKITTRCAEIDREMIDQLGVSKAILNHVIFCHQEESSWPLSEGKSLKSKFDDIFASTRYTTALDNFKTIQKELMTDINVCKKELHYLDERKVKVDEVKGNLQEKQRKVENSKTEITCIKCELTPLEVRLQELTGKYDEVSRIEREIATSESSRKELLKSQQQLEARIEDMFTGTKVELQQECEQHRSMVERNSLELEELERKLTRLVKFVDSKKGILDNCHKEHGRLKTEEQYHKDRVASRDKNMVAMATQYSLPGYKAGPFEQSEVIKFLTEFGQVKKDADENGKLERQKLSREEHDLQEQLDKLHSNLAKIEESVRIKETTSKESRKKISEITRELKTIGSGTAALEEVEQELTSADKELREYQQQTDLKSMEEALDRLSRDKQKLSSKVTQLQREFHQLSLQSSARGVMDELRRQKRNKEENYQLELESLQPELLSVFGEMPSLEDNLSSRLKDLVRSKEQEKQVSSDQYRQATAQAARLQTQLEEKENQLRGRRNRAETLQREVSEVCGEENTSNYQELVEALQTQIDSASENISTVKGSQSFFRKSLEKLHSNHKCPLCMRGFEERSSLDNTIKLITMRLNEVIPHMIPRLNDELHQLQERQKKLQELKPKIEELSQIRSEEVSRLESLLEEKKKATAKVQTNIAREEEKLSAIQKELEHIRSLQPKVTKVTQLKEQLEELDEKINVEESKFSNMKVGSSRSQHLVNRELTDVQKDVEELDRKMDRTRQEITDTQQTVGDMEKRVHSLREEKLHLQSQFQKRETLLTRKKDLTIQMESLEREAKMESSRVGPVKEKIKDLMTRKKELGIKREVVEAEIRMKIDSLRQALEGVKNRSDHIDRYVRGGGETALEECEERIQNLTQEIEAEHGKKKEFEGKIGTLTKQLANAKNKERDLTDNLQLLTQREEIEKKSQTVKDLKDVLRRMGLEAYEDEYQRLQTDVDRLRKDQARAEGHKLGLEDHVKHLQMELQSELYSGIEEKHMDMVIKLKTTETASRDLGKYYKALDRAIMRFHSRKMDEINQIIRELWIKTYKGGDIDTIEIRSDSSETSTQTDSTTIATRRIYNYRVVMVKGRTELDMRGRCSAGQKVLASIIIRLALAETFCLTSGLLALDEPTTNLDRDNVEGLAQALTDIIKERSKNQKNFQLVIITHDEAFVELLGHTGYTDCFYKVTKNIGETSKITRFYF